MAVPDHHIKGTKSPHGPAQAALAFMKAIFGERSLRSAWRLADENFRLEAAQGWAESHQPQIVGAVVESLAREDSDDPLWPVFAHDVIEGIASDLPDFRLDDSWGVDTAPRVLGIDTERVKFFPRAGIPDVVTRLTAVRVIALTMRYDGERWRVVEIETAHPDD